MGYSLSLMLFLLRLKIDYSSSGAILCLPHPYALYQETRMYVKPAVGQQDESGRKHGRCQASVIYNSLEASPNSLVDGIFIELKHNLSYEFPL